MYNYNRFSRVTEFTSQNKDKKKKDHFDKGRNDQTDVSPKNYPFKNSIQPIDQRNKEMHQNNVDAKTRNEKVWHVQTSGPRARVLKS